MSPKKNPGLCPKCGLWNEPTQNRCRACDTPLTGLAAMSAGKRAKLPLALVGAGVGFLIVLGTLVIYFVAGK